MIPSRELARSCRCGEVAEPRGSFPRGLCARERPSDCSRRRLVPNYVDGFWPLFLRLPSGEYLGRFLPIRTLLDHGLHFKNQSEQEKNPSEIEGKGRNLCEARHCRQQCDNHESNCSAKNHQHGPRLPVRRPAIPLFNGDSAAQNPQRPFHRALRTSTHREPEPISASMKSRPARCSPLRVQPESAVQDPADAPVPLIFEPC